MRRAGACGAPACSPCKAANLGLSNTRGGALVFQHRFGGSLNLNTHLHAVVADGVFQRTEATDRAQQATFQPLPPPEPVELVAVAFNVYRRFAGWLKKNSLASCFRGCLGIGKVVEMTAEGDIQVREEDQDAQRFALSRSPHVGEFGEFSIHAGVTVDAADRDGRELEFLARISAVIPPPRHPLVRYFGVFGPNCSWRKLCVPHVIDVQPRSTTTLRAPGSHKPATDNNAALRSEIRKASALSADPMSESDTANRASPAVDRWRLDWATLLRRTYDLDVLTCPCGGRLKAVELVTESERAKELLEQFGMPTKSPPIARARSPDWDC